MLLFELYRRQAFIEPMPPLWIVKHLDIVEDVLSCLLAGGGFEDPRVYVTAIRELHGDEFKEPFASDYVASGSERPTGAVIVGTSLGLLMSPF